MSAWRIQRRTDSGAMSKSAATSLIFRSPRRATATTSRLNSGGNLFGIATSFPRDLVPRKKCQPNAQQTHVHYDAVAACFLLVMLALACLAFVNGLTLVGLVAKLRKLDDESASPSPK